VLYDVKQAFFRTLLTVGSIRPADTPEQSWQTGSLMQPLVLTPSIVSPHHDPSRLRRLGQLNERNNDD
jgi:hypothetical protein